MKTFQELYEDLLRQKVSVEEPLPREYDPKHLDCLLHPEEYAPVISTDTCTSDRAERAGGRALRNGTCRNRAFADRTVKRNGVYCSPFAGNGWDQPAEIVYGFVDRSRTGYEYCEK